MKLPRRDRYPDVADDKRLCTTGPMAGELHDWRTADSRCVNCGRANPDDPSRGRLLER